MTRHVSARRLRRRSSIREFALLVAVFGFATATFTMSRAEEPAPTNSLADSKSPDTKGKAPSLLVMQNGRVIDGRINQCAGGYFVEKENGNMIIPFDMVQFGADDLSDAHRKLQKRVPDQTPETRLTLARWCLANRLRDEAIDELRAALELDPDNEEAKQILQRIDTIKSERNSAPVEDSPKVETTPDGFRPQESVSLAGLSHETVRDFSTRIQPILLNKCGNANCHGAPSGGEFQLTHLRGGQGNRRRVVEENLAATLRQLSIEKPKESPLLVAPQGSHGRNGRMVFVGAHDEVLHKTLEKWVQQVAVEKTGGRERSGGANSSASFPGKKRKFGERAQGEAGSNAFATIPQSPFASALANPGSLTESAVQAQKDAAKNTLDAFDPSTFNRKTFGNYPAK